ncbi:MAG TPA: restriction endonuclease subunit S [Verrucomicrobiae bacterium]
MKLPAYPRTKPSGIEWLGDVPEHWKVRRLKTSATCWVSNVDKVPAEDEPPVRLCNYTDVYYHDYITPDMELMETTATADEIRRFGLRVGDVVITKDSEEWSDIAVPALVKKTALDLVCGYHLAIIRSRPKALFGDYLLRALQSCAVNQQFQVAASGVTRYGLPKASIGEAWIPLPDPTEQRAIAAFLDRETGRVDRLVAKKRELIERLKEKRTALISRTVTRGLPPAAARAAGLPANPPLKPSGLDWLGDAPAHWEALTVRRRAKRIQTGGTPPTAEERYYEDGTVPWFGPGSFDDQIVVSQPIKLLNSSAVKEGAGRMFAAGATMVVTIGATLGKVSSLAEAGSCNQQITVIEFDYRRIHPRFATYQLKRLEPALRAIAPSATLPILDQGEIADIAIGLPPLPEQAAIAAYLDLETAKLDALVGKVEEAVERLQEYRTALITAAVTGKIDVRKAVPAGSSTAALR